MALSNSTFVFQVEFMHYPNTASSDYILGIGGAGRAVAYKLSKRISPKHCYILDVDDSLFEARSSLNYLKIGNIDFPLDANERSKMTVSEQMIRECLFTSAAKIKHLLEKLPDYLFILAGLAGKTTSILLPYVLEQAKEKGKTVLVFTWSPLHFEGRLRKQRFSDAVNKIIYLGDYLFIQNNQSIAAQNREENLSSLYKKLDETIIKQIENLITDRPE